MHTRSIWVSSSSPLTAVHALLNVEASRFVREPPDGIPHLSSGMAELLIYCWQFFPGIRSRATCVNFITILIADSQSPVEKYEKVLVKVITDAQEADHIARVLFKDLRNKALVDEKLAWYFEFLDILMRGSPLFAQSGTIKIDARTGILRSMAAACQRQLCSGSESNARWRLPNIRKGLTVIMYSY